MKVARSAILAIAFFVASLSLPFLRANDALPKSSRTSHLTKRSLTSILTKAANGEEHSMKPTLVETKIGASSGKPKFAFDLNLSPDELFDEDPPIFAGTNAAAAISVAHSKLTHKAVGTNPQVLHSEGTASSPIPEHSCHDPTRGSRETQPDGLRNNCNNVNSAVDFPRFLSLDVPPSSTGLEEDVHSSPQPSSNIRTAMGKDLHLTPSTLGAPGKHQREKVPAGVTTGLAHQGLSPKSTYPESHLAVGGSRAQRAADADSPPSSIMSAAPMPLTVPLVPYVEKPRDDRMRLNGQPTAAAQGAFIQALPGGDSGHSSTQPAIGWTASKQKLTQDPVPSTLEVAANLLSLAYNLERPRPSQPVGHLGEESPPMKPDSTGFREQTGKKGRTAPSFSDMKKYACGSPDNMGASEQTVVRPRLSREMPRSSDSDCPTEADPRPVSSNSQPSRSDSPSVEGLLPPKKYYTRKEKKPWYLSEHRHEGQATSSWHSKKGRGERPGRSAAAQQKPTAPQTTSPSSTGQASETRATSESPPIRAAERYRKISATRTPGVEPSPKRNKSQPRESSPAAIESNASGEDYSATDYIPISQISINRKAKAQKIVPDADKTSSRPIRTKKKVAWLAESTYSQLSDAEFENETRHSSKKKGKAKEAVGTKRKHEDVGDQFELQSSEDELEAAEVRQESEPIENEPPQVKKVIRQWEPSDLCWHNPEFYIRIDNTFPPGHNAGNGQASKTQKVTTASAIGASGLETAEGLGTQIPKKAATSATELTAQGLNTPKTIKLKVKPISRLGTGKFVTGGSHKPLAKPSGKSVRQKQKVGSS